MARRAPPGQGCVVLVESTPRYNPSQDFKHLAGRSKLDAELSLVIAKYWPEEAAKKEIVRRK
jgi:hypothetical protein